MKKLIIYENLSITKELLKKKIVPKLNEKKKKAFNELLNRYE